jgi:hypothetical protein
MSTLYDFRLFNHKILLTRTTSISKSYGLHEKMSDLGCTARQYWLDYVLPTAKTAVQDLRDFVLQLTPEGEELCLYTSFIHSDSIIMRAIGADIYGDTYLSDFDFVELRIRRVVAHLSNVHRDWSFMVPTVENVARLWLNDVMVSVYFLAEMYHAAIPYVPLYMKTCSPGNGGFSSRFPHVVPWQNDHRASFLEKCLYTTKFVVLDTGDMDVPGSTTPQLTSQGAVWFISPVASLNMSFSSSMSDENPPRFPRKSGMCPPSLPPGAKRARLI